MALVMPMVRVPEVTGCHQSGIAIWTCGTCTLDNPNTSVACNVCGAARPSPPGVWACSVCSFHNSEHDSRSLQCVMCGTSRTPASEPLAAIEQATPPLGWWECTACTLHNPGSNSVCCCCGGPKCGEGVPSLPSLENQCSDLFEIGGGRGGPGDKRFITWITERRFALPEYRHAASTICVRKELMAESRTASAVEHLMARHSSTAAVPRSFDEVVLNAVKKVWGASNDRTAKTLTCDVPGLARGNPFQGVQQTHRDLQAWQRDVLRIALHHLTIEGDVEDLRMAIGMLMRGAQECQSRKIWAFYAVLVQCAPHRSADARDALSIARGRILDAAREFLDDEKDAAFNTYFMEPSWMYLAAFRDGNPDVNVHGANTYLAALAAALGVRFSREPFLDDESKGVTPFLDFRFEGGALESLQDPRNFGKSWEAVRECRNPKLPRNAMRTAHRWLRDGGSPIDTANLALSNDAKTRNRLKPYLESFAQAFSAQRFLPRLFSRLVKDDVLTDALNQELASFHKDGLRADGDDDGTESDCRYFLWDLEGSEPKFRLQRAVMLFSRAGVVKPNAL